MPKKRALWIPLIIVIIVLFVTPVRKYLSSLFYKNKGEITEMQTIGPISEYNTRVKEVQKILQETGFEAGPIDGLMGGQTRRAIREFQKAKGLKPTGKIDSTTYLALNKEKETIKSTTKTMPKSNSFVDSASSTNLKDEDSKFEIQDAKKKTEVQDEVLSYRLKSKDRIKQIQRALKNAGFYKGEIDGREGPQTKRAIRAFQKSKGINPDSVVGSKTWQELSKYLK